MDTKNGPSCKAAWVCAQPGCVWVFGELRRKGVTALGGMGVGQIYKVSIVDPRV